MGRAAQVRRQPLYSQHQPAVVVTVRVFVTPMLVRDIGVSRQLSVEARSVEELLRRVDTEVPGFRDSICDETGRIRGYVNVFVNGVNIRPRADALVTALRDGDRVHILPSVAGGGLEMMLQHG